MEYQKFTIKEAIKKIIDHKLYLPAIQRKFVWEVGQIERLFDSIMRGYPIGTFLFWMVEEAKHNDYSFYEFIRDFHERDNWANTLAAKPHLPDDLIGVLDGQQRLNSMYVALQGSYAYKKPRVWKNNPDAYPIRRFYLNVLKSETESDGQDYVYELRFLTDKEAAKISKTECWCLVKKMLECKELSDVSDYWDEVRERFPTGLELSKIEGKPALKMLGNLWQKLNNTSLINYFPIENQELDQIVDIFVRINSAGTTLSRTDLLFSTIVAQWEDGRTAIEEFLDKLNAKGGGFGFDTDFMMRACLVLADCPVRLKVASFKAGNVKLIISKWESITAALDKAIDLLVEWGFQGETLSSSNAAIPIGQAVMLGFNLKTSRSDLRLLLVKSLLTGLYGGQGDQVLTALRKSLQSARKRGDKFSLAYLEKYAALPGGKSLTVSDDDLEDLLLTQKGPRSFLLLALLAPHLNFHQAQFHQDHIHPYSKFSWSALTLLKKPPEQIADWQAKRDALPNLRLLEGKDNLSKLALPFKDWLAKQFPKLADRKSYLQTQIIPDHAPLSFDQFDDFFEVRKEALRERLREILSVSPS